mmetsp:Transcript_41373/g.88870  ORF Transcript_41373/g.88870 Transcript_41373/m.88870 type:complete len:216 (+) Transcript_41373:264-911(+)
MKEFASRRSRKRRCWRLAETLRLLDKKRCCSRHRSQCNHPPLPPEPSRMTRLHRQRAAAEVRTHGPPVAGACERQRTVDGARGGIATLPEGLRTRMAHGRGPSPASLLAAATDPSIHHNTKMATQTRPSTTTTMKKMVRGTTTSTTEMSPPTTTSTTSTTIPLTLRWMGWGSPHESRGCIARRGSSATPVVASISNISTTTPSATPTPASRTATP